jgi:hypothetical protein
VSAVAVGLNSGVFHLQCGLLRENDNDGICSSVP